LWDYLIKMTPSYTRKRKHTTSINPEDISKIMEFEKIIIESENEISIDDKDKWMEMEDNLYDNGKDVIRVRRSNRFKEKD